MRPAGHIYSIGSRLAASGHGRSSWSLALILLLFLVLCAPGWAANYQDPAYQAAVADARTPTPAEIDNHLTAIVAYNSNLVWEGVPGASRVKMAALTRNFYDNYEGRDYQLSFGELWVTVAPEMRQFFQGQASAPTMRRLEQLLGLPPDNGYTRIVEFWVNPGDMFRPSPDPEISDTVAELDFPQGSRTSVADGYQSWFAQAKHDRFDTDKPYPWTQLGYTYDWGSNGHIGLSEFVVEQGSTVGVSKVYAPDDYFKARPM
jgi:hypothetical protein